MKPEPTSDDQRLRVPPRAGLGLRWKFFIGLMLFSLVPVLTVTVLVNNLTREVKLDLFAKTRTTLTEQASLELVYLASNYASMLKQGETSSQILLQSVFDTVLPRLQPGQSTQVPYRGTVLFDTEYVRTVPIPSDLMRDDRYLPVAKHNAGTQRMQAGESMQSIQAMESMPMRGGMSPMSEMMPMSGMGGDSPTSTGMVSFSSLAFHRAPGADVVKTGEQARILAPIVRSIQQYYNMFHGKVYRIYAGFASGLHMTYPGHADLPVTYDPRNRGWYTRAVEAGKMIWTLPLTDASTGRVTITGSQPMYSAEGMLLGVVGLDILWEEVLNSNVIHSGWSQDTSLMIAALTGSKEQGTSFLEIIAETSKEDTKGLWQMEGRHRRMMFSREAQGPQQMEGQHGRMMLPDHTAEDSLREAMQEQGSGTISLPWEGVDSLWAWAMLPDKSGYVIAIVPSASVLRIPNLITATLGQASQAQRQIVTASILFIALLVFGGAFYASKALTTPMYELITVAKRIAGGDFSARVNMHTGDERDTVIEALNDMGPQLAELVATRESLGIAREVQENLLPRTNPVLSGWDIAGVSRYSDETGGDFYDYFPIQREGGTCLSISVGDVSGHGIPSALLMATARALIRGQSECGNLGLAEQTTRVNRMLAKDLYGSGRFMTLFGIEMNGHSGEISWVRAGHDPALVYYAGSDSFSSLEGSGLPLGVLDDTEYTEQASAEFVAGDVILVGTDGIWEARHPERGEMYGKDRVRDLMRRCAGLSAEAMCESLLDDLRVWRQGKPWKDDVTLVVIKKTA